jgi:hypothetical protein
MENAVERGPEWAGLPIIATVARLLCHTGRIRTPFTGLHAEGVGEFAQEIGSRKKELTAAGGSRRWYRYLPHKRGLAPPLSVGPRAT